MNVLIVSIGKLVGGVEKYTLSLGKMLESEGLDVFYALRENSWLSEQIADNKIELNLSSWHILTAYKQVTKYVELKNINIILCNSNNGLFLCKNVSDTLSCKKIGVIHGDVIVDQKQKGNIVASIYEKLETWLVKEKCSRCIAVSQSIKDLLINRGVDANKLEVVYSGISIEKYDCFPNYYSDEFRICSVGYLRPVKNQIALLEALNMMKKSHPEAKIICDIYGEGPERTNLENYINENNMEYVNLKGFDANIRKHLNEYQLFVQPSTYESFGLAVLEAMNAGCGVLANCVGGMKEILQEIPETLVDVENRDAFSLAIYKYYSDRKFLEEIGQVCCEKSCSDFSEIGMAKRTIDLFERELGKK